MNSPADPSANGHTPAASNQLDNGPAMAGPKSPPPIIPDSSTGQYGTSGSFQNFVAMALSLCLIVVLIAGAVSLVDDTLVLAWGQHLFTSASAILTFIAFVFLMFVYGLMGLTPLIPKRVFLPIVILTGLGLLAVIPTMIYFYDQLIKIDWLLSFLQVVLVLLICRWLLHRSRFRWNVVEAKHLGRPAFSWWNLSVFLLLNVFVVVPAVATYLAFSVSLAVSHFTDGFLTVRPVGLILQARKYVREDGKTILLFPMSHIAEADFYQAMAHSVASNSIVLLEGVTDEKKLLTNHLSYKRAAKALGLAEQHDDLKIRQGQLVRADVDIQDFSSNTIAILNLITLVHTRGISPDTLFQLLQFQPTPEADQQLFADLLLKRNDHLLKELWKRLPDSNNFVIPWGAAHMSGLANAIQKAGFHLVETHDYVSIRFGRKANQDARPREPHASGDSR